jgi:hypothetical protein
MEKKDQPIYPTMMQQVGNDSFRMAKPNDPKEWNVPCAGLTKREWFAGQALSGYLASMNPRSFGKSFAVAIKEICFTIADEMLTP